MWIIDRVEGNIRERDRNGKQDELIGGWKNRPCFRTMQVIGEERIGRIIELREYWNGASCGWKRFAKSLG